jgi:hypothetical protein
VAWTCFPVYNQNLTWFEILLGSWCLYNILSYVLAYPLSRLAIDVRFNITFLFSYFCCFSFGLFLSLTSSHDIFTTLKFFIYPLSFGTSIQTSKCNWSSKKKGARKTNWSQNNIGAIIVFRDYDTSHQSPSKHSTPCEYINNKAFSEKVNVHPFIYLCY